MRFQKSQANCPRKLIGRIVAKSGRRCAWNVQMTVAGQANQMAYSYGGVRSKDGDIPRLQLQRMTGGLFSAPFFSEYSSKWGFLIHWEDFTFTHSSRWNQNAAEKRQILKKISSIFRIVFEMKDFAVKRLLLTMSSLFAENIPAAIRLHMFHTNARVVES